MKTFAFAFACKKYRRVQAAQASHSRFIPIVLACLISRSSFTFLACRASGRGSTFQSSPRVVNRSRLQLHTMQAYVPSPRCHVGTDMQSLEARNMPLFRSNGDRTCNTQSLAAKWRSCYPTTGHFFCECAEAGVLRHLLAENSIQVCLCFCPAPKAISTDLSRSTLDPCRAWIRCSKTAGSFDLHTLAAEQKPVLSCIPTPWYIPL